MKTLRLDDENYDGVYMELRPEEAGVYLRPAYLTVVGRGGCVGLTRDQLYRLAEDALRIARKA